MWTVRDFTLELELKGKPITADEYLENALKLKSGETHTHSHTHTHSLTVSLLSPCPQMRLSIACLAQGSTSS